MRRHRRLNNPFGVRRYLAQFEQRFARVPDGVLYVAEEGGEGVLLGEAEAASLIAGMRATLYEADAAHPYWGSDAGLLAGLSAGAILIAGAVTDFVALAGALVLPVAAAILLLGPVLGGASIHLAYCDAADEVERHLRDRERVPADEVARAVAPNPLRRVLILTCLFLGAILFGLIAAAWGTPLYARATLDDALSPIARPLVLLLVALAFAAILVDRAGRRRVSEAAIALALRERRRRPLV